MTEDKRPKTPEEACVPLATLLVELAEVCRLQANVIGGIAKVLVEIAELVESEENE